MQTTKSKPYHPVDIILEQPQPRICLSEEDLPIEKRFYYNLLKLNTTPNVSDIFTILPNKITLKDCNAEILEILELKLNPIVIGSMKNWEYLASKFGISNDLVMNMRNYISPMKEFLKNYSHIELNCLLKEIETMNRMDVLISLRNPLNNFKKHYNEGYSNLDTGLQMSSQTKSFQTYITHKDSSHTTMDNISLFGYGDNYILLLHYEIEKEDKKKFKWFRGNIERSSKDKIKVYDFDKAVDKSNIYLSSKALFENATYIVCLFTDDWCNIINSTTKNKLSPCNESEIVKCKNYVLNLMETEMIENDFINKRFIPVIYENFKKSLLPMGWPKNTLSYQFPNNFNELCTKLFSEN
uniref:F-box domain-containing protein n=1 Tax=Parastrongyloides trichosuri TaxID=131310 RepID=A0A0N4ZW74_PARTI